jgi:hypothetical protein
MGMIIKKDLEKKYTDSQLFGVGLVKIYSNGKTIESERVFIDMENRAEVLIMEEITRLLLELKQARKT